MYYKLLGQCRLNSINTYIVQNLLVIHRYNVQQARKPVTVILGAILGGLGVILGPFACKIEWGKAKRADFERFATTTLSRGLGLFEQSKLLS